jgi:uncharacterized protein (TIGR03435 family)
VHQLPTQRRRTRVAVAAFAVVACAASAQPPDAAPQFEAISVTPISTGPIIGRTCRGDRFTEKRGPIWGLVAFAFQFNYVRIQGLPSWAYDSPSGYSIEAKAPAAMSQAECRAMVQSLLASRFNLSAHREQKEMRAYALTVTKKGPKMREVAPGSKDFAIMNGEVTFRSATGSGPTGVSMATLADDLSGLSAINAPVIDRTGLPGTYAFELNFSTREDDGRPTIWTALQEQLGLKLESIKAPIEVLVVDHIERPTAN